MMRILFNSTDLARVRVAPSYGPIAETMLGLGALTSRPRSSQDRLWAAAQTLTAAERSVVSYLRPLRTVGVDFITLGGPARSLREGQENLLDAPAEHFVTELAAFTRRPELVQGLPWVQSLEAGDQRSRRRLVTALGRLHERLIAPSWAGAEQHLEAVKAQMARRLAEGGVEAVMSGLGAGTRWSSGRLELPDAGCWEPDPIDVHLDGCGLVLVPSYHARWLEPYFPIAGHSPPVLFVPTHRQLIDPTRPTLEGVGRLMGHTRAAVLHAVSVQPGTTTEIAARLGITASGASQHAAALRDGGLLITVRDGRHVLHSATGLGHALIERLDRNEG